jgi:phenylacetate-CoA ligase
MLIHEFLYSEYSRRYLHLPPKELKELQFKKTKKLLKIAYETVPFYNRKLKNARIHPDDIKNFQDYAKVPTVTKAEIQSNPTKNHINQNVKQNSLIWRNTSGSTGIPLNIGLNQQTLDLEGAIWHRALSENGLKIRDKRTIIGDPRSFPKQKSAVENLGLIKRQHLSIFDDANTQLAYMESFRPDVIKAYPSSLTILADYNKQRTRKLKPRIVFTTSEILDKHSKGYINHSFETEVFDNYSCTEFALIAWECKKHQGYHINADSVMLEFVENGENVDYGERGEIICTGLLNQTMPLIRYEIGDIGVPLNDQCSCGRTLPLMQTVEGRTDDFLISTDGKVISPTIFFPYPFKNYEEIQQFRVIQENIDKIVIQVIPRSGISNKQQIFRDVEANIKLLFGDSMKVNFQALDAFERDSTGKLRKIITKVNPVDCACRHYN